MNHYLRMAVVLGLITAVGPFAVDMYLPALPTIGASLNASTAAVQASLLSFFIVFGFCQLFYGPIADIFGRKLPIYAGLVLFAIGSVGCALAPDIETLIAFRVLQAFGSCAGMVVPRAIVRDLHTGHEATRLMSFLLLVMSVSPIMAPLFGSGVIAVIGWRGVFWALTVAALIAILLAVFALEETRPHAARRGSSWGGAFRAYGLLLKDKSFIGLSMVGAFGLSAFFVYLGNSPFVLKEQYGLSEWQFSLCFSLNAASFFGVSQLTGYMTKRYGLASVVRVSVAGMAVAMTILAVIMLSGFDGLPVMIVGLFVGYGFLGLVLPTAGVLSLEHHGAIAGAASALGGALGMMTGAVIMSLSGLFAEAGAKPMVAMIALCAILACVTTFLTLRKPQAGSLARATR
ncbi:multidrug effflux MFS transporter [Dongia sp.]|uniref:multidrug effflux MFS transporter n=1 Tax=Dongia sp. TaxID=1977262 RepID=UPI0037520981